MNDSDQWQLLGVHWHAYAEPRAPHDASRAQRVERLHAEPDAVLCTPHEVTDWIATQMDEQARPIAVQLLANAHGPGGSGHIGDHEHVAYTSLEHLNDACRGDSLYVDFPREHDRLHLWIEAVTTDECPEVHEL